MLSEKLLPTVNDCLLYVLSRTSKHIRNKITHSEAVAVLARKVEDIWKKADCCPFSRKHIMTLLVTNIWQQYCFLLRENHLSSETNVKKRSHKKNPDKPKEHHEPIRKSKRLDPFAIVNETSISITKNSAEVEKASSSTTTSTRSKSLPLRDTWNKVGMMLLMLKVKIVLMNVLKLAFVLMRHFIQIKKV